MLTSTLRKTLLPENRYRSACGRRSGFFWLPPARQGRHSGEFWVFCEETLEDTSSHLLYNAEEAEKALRTWVDEGTKPAFSLTPMGRKQIIKEFTERVYSFTDKLYAADYLQVLVEAVFEAIQVAVDSKVEGKHDHRVGDARKAVQDLIDECAGGPVCATIQNKNRVRGKT